MTGNDECALAIYALVHEIELCAMATGTGKQNRETRERERERERERDERERERCVCVREMLREEEGGGEREDKEE